LQYQRSQYLRNLVISDCTLDVLHSYSHKHKKTKAIHAYKQLECKKSYENHLFYVCYHFVVK